MSHAMRRRLLDILPLVIVFGCGPKVDEPVPDDAADRYAAAICAAYERCGCMAEGIVDQPTCLQEAKQKFERIESLPGIRFNASCLEPRLEFIDDNNCADAASPDRDEYSCALFSGTLQIGESCPDWGLGAGIDYGANSCAKGLLCIAGRCTKPPKPAVSEGEPCYLDLDVSCGEGQYCSSEARCRPKVGVGQSCDTPSACTYEFYCAGLRQPGDVGECRERIGLGAACDPTEVDSCVEASYASYCSTAGMCTLSGWPLICEPVSLAPDRSDPRIWIPASP
jgi:hypothetical protein